MKKKSTPVTRRAGLSRLGLFATAAYVVPGFSTLSTARASSVSSASSASSGASLPSDYSCTAGQVRKYNSCKKTSTTMDDFRTCLVIP